MKALIRSLDRKFEEIICSLCLLVMSFCIGFQVLLRYVFHASSPWAEELAVFSMIFAVYLGASMAIRERGHIRIVVLVNALPRPLQIVSVVLADFLWFGFLVFMAWQSIVFTQLLFDVVYISPGLGID